MKKIKLVSVSLLVVLLICLTGCKSNNISGTLDEIMNKLYAGIAEEYLPMMLSNTEITVDNIENYVGVSDISFEEGIVSESQVGSIAHSVVLLRIKDGENIETIKTEIEKNANPQKWICVSADEVKVMSRGNIILLVMSNTDLTNKIVDNFNNL